VEEAALRNKISEPVVFNPRCLSESSIFHVGACLAIFCLGVAAWQSSVGQKPPVLASIAISMATFVASVEVKSVADALLYFPEKMIPIESEVS
jgi:hypothetical protein